MLTLNFDLVSDSLTSRIMGMCVLRLAPATVKFTYTGLTHAHGSPTFGSMFSSLRAQPRFGAQRKATAAGAVIHYFGGAGFPAG